MVYNIFVVIEIACFINSQLWKRKILEEEEETKKW